MEVSLLELVGRLHPLLIHFPIAFLLLNAVLEAWSIKWNIPAIASTIRLSAVLGAFGAIAAAATGWVFSSEHHRSDNALLLAQHRWLGVATAVLALLAWFAVWRWSGATQSRYIWFRRSAIWTSAILLVVAAHFGAKLVWGDDFFSS